MQFHTNEMHAPLLTRTLQGGVLQLVPYLSTIKYLVDLYHASIEKKDKNIETNFTL
jgi:hypothetical protein